MLCESLEILGRIKQRLSQMSFPYLCLTTFFVIALGSCASLFHSVDEALLPEAVPLGEPREQNYSFELGDVIEVKFFYYPELNEHITVRPDGMISLQLVGEVRAVGVTPSELSQILKQRYADYLEKPEVVVLAREFANERIYVGGEVRTPSEIPIKGRLTLMQAVFKAGGLTDRARSSNVLLLRSEGADLKVFKVNLDEVLEKGGNDVLLRPLDIVYVPKTLIAKVDQFVEQYINQIIPESVNFPFVYLMNPRESRGAVVITGGP